jgi:hypothetical protein
MQVVVRQVIQAHLLNQLQLEPTQSRQLLLRMTILPLSAQVVTLQSLQQSLHQLLELSQLPHLKQLAKL